MDTFFLQTYYATPDSGEVDNHLPPHDLILKPILSGASEVLVFDAPQSTYAIECVPPILRGGPPNFALDPSQELVDGHEAFWNSCRGERGCIAIASRIPEPELAQIFGFCGEAGVFAHKSDEYAFFSRAACRYARQTTTAGGLRVFLVSSSNGIETMGVYCHPTESERLFEVARANAKPFKRWFEVSEPERFNIIGKYHLR